LAYKARFAESALKQLRRLDRQVQRRIIAFVENRLEQLDDPRSVGEALRGEDLGEFWKYRVGDYRLVCDIQDSVLAIEVLKIGDRKEVYR
jgi:mRNA interferase RelE/StbE